MAIKQLPFDDMRSSPLQIASRCGQLDVVKLLVNDYGINISTSDDAGFKNACEEWHIDVIQYFLSHPDFNPDQEYSFGPWIMLMCFDYFLKINDWILHLIIIKH